MEGRFDQTAQDQKKRNDERGSQQREKKSGGTRVERIAQPERQKRRGGNRCFKNCGGLPQGGIRLRPAARVFAGSLEGKDQQQPDGNMQNDFAPLAIEELAGGLETFEKVFRRRDGFRRGGLEGRPERRTVTDEQAVHRLAPGPSEGGEGLGDPGALVGQPSLEFQQLGPPGINRIVGGGNLVAHGGDAGGQIRGRIRWLGGFPQRIHFRDPGGLVVEAAEFFIDEAGPKIGVVAQQAPPGGLLLNHADLGCGGNQAGGLDFIEIDIRFELGQKFGQVVGEAVAAKGPLDFRQGGAGFVRFGDDGGKPDGHNRRRRRGGHRDRRGRAKQGGERKQAQSQKAGHGRPSYAAWG